MIKNQIYVLELRSGKTIICFVENIGKVSINVNNPMIIYPANENQLGFAPLVYTDPKKMACNIHINAIDIHYIPDDEILSAYSEYVKKLTSSIIQLDASIKKIQLNG